MFMDSVNQSWMDIHRIKIYTYIYIYIYVCVYIYKSALVIEPYEW